MTGPRIRQRIDLSLDRGLRASLADQFRERLADAIETGSLAPGSRLPSWRDLASQLGIARGTVERAYQRLIDAQLIVSSGARGTRVAESPPRRRDRSAIVARSQPGFPFFAIDPLPLQVGVPSQAAFPAALWGRLAKQSMRESLQRSVGYPDPCGEPGLRREIANHLALARGLRCDAAQVVITSGYGAALGLVLRALDSSGKRAWMEEPGYPVNRLSMAFAGIRPVLIPVDREGMCVEYAVRTAPDACLAIVTPGQQAPLGVTLSQARRLSLITWAANNDAWIIEDDYLGELQLGQRAALSLAAQDAGDRTIHIGTFSKTVSPLLRLGFIVVPSVLLEKITYAISFGEPAPSPFVQSTLAAFMREGHYLRHLRRMRFLYRRHGETLRALVANTGVQSMMTGLALLVRLPRGADDQTIAAAARQRGFSPNALSNWYAHRNDSPGGLLLGITNIDEQTAKNAWKAIRPLIG